MSVIAAPIMPPVQDSAVATGNWRAEPNSTSCLASAIVSGRVHQLSSVGNRTVAVRHRGNTLAPSCKSKLFRGCCFYGDACFANAHDVSKAFAHFIPVRTNFWRLTNNGDITMDDCPGRALRPSHMPF